MQKKKEMKLLFLNSFLLNYKPINGSVQVGFVSNLQRPNQNRWETTRPAANS